jgi:serine/threonine protein kinase
LGAGTYGIVREAECPEGKVAVKIILKKNVKGNEQMVYDELEMLQKMKHPHIVKFHDWFESRVCPTRLPVAMCSADLWIGQVLHCHSARYGWRVV